MLTATTMQPCRHAIAALCLGAFFGAGMAPAAVPAGETKHAEIVCAASSHLRLGIDARSGTLLEIADIRVKHNHVDSRIATTQSGGLWDLRLRRGADRVVLTPLQAKSFRTEAIPGEPGGLRLIWDRFSVSSTEQVKVEVALRLDADAPMSGWTIAVEGLAGLAVEEIRFPRILGIARQERERLAVPVWMGQQAVDPRRMLAGKAKKASRWAWDYPGPLSLQCLAYYQDGGPGLYVACDDIGAQRKTFAVEADAQSQISLELTHYPQARPADKDRTALDYQVRLGTFRGDWFTAAERYRTWALRQPWARESRLQKGLVPDWVLKTGIWVWNRGRSPQVLPPAAALKERLGLPVSVFWHWWHGCPYDTGFPEYFPPREGTEPMKSALADAHGKDVRALVYMNQRLWGTTTKSWQEEGAERYAVKGPDGKTAPEVYNIFTKQPCAAMCMGTPFWRNKYAGLAERAVRELGVGGIYMDQACLSAPCYDPAHGHPLGSGNFWTEGFRLLADDIRRRTRSHNCRERPPWRSGIRQETPCSAPRNATEGVPYSDVALAGEGCGETWLADLDLMLSLQVSKERYAGQDGWETIPFFHAVYHPFAVLYGNYSSLAAPPYDDLWPAQFAPKSPLALLDAKFSRQFRLEQARAFVWGQQPTIANLLSEHFEKRPEEIAYAMRLARIRSRTLKYLLHGTLLRPLALQTPEVEIDFSRLSIYAGRGGGITSFRKASSSVIGAAWRAPDGDVCVALASIADHELCFPLSLDRAEYVLPARGNVYRIDETGRSLLGPLRADPPLMEIRLPAYGACGIEFAGDRSP